MHANHPWCMAMSASHHSCGVPWWHAHFQLWARMWLRAAPRHTWHPACQCTPLGHFLAHLLALRVPTGGACALGGLCGKCPKWHFPHCMAVAAAALCGPPWPPTPHPKVLLVPMKGHGVHIGHPKPTPSLGHHHHPQYALTTNQFFCGFLAIISY